MIKKYIEHEFKVKDEDFFVQAEVNVDGYFDENWDSGFYFGTSYTSLINKEFNPTDIEIVSLMAFKGESESPIDDKELLKLLEKEVIKLTEGSFI